MEIRQLKHFVAIVEHRTLRAASKFVGLSQPALTRSIQKLEEGLQVSLLTRKARRVSPTPVGAKFYQHAKLILNECDRAADAAALLQDGVEGEINIGIGPIFANYLVDVAIARSVARYPRLHIKVIEGLYEDLVDRLQAGALDLAILPYALPKIPKGISRGDPIIHLSSAAFVRSQHPLAKKRKITVSDTIDCKWLVIDQPLAVNFHGQIFENLGLEAPRESITTNSFPLIKSLLLLDDFITIAPQEFFRDEISQGLLKKLNLQEFAFDRKAGIVSRESQLLIPAISQFVEVLKAVCVEFQSVPEAI